MSEPTRNHEPVAKNDIEALRKSLKQLREEVRLKIHLGGMDVRDAFQKIEHEADHLAAQAQPAATRVLNDLAARLRRIAHALDGND